MSALVIDLATLKPGVNRLEFECDTGALDLPTTEWQGRVRGEADVEKFGEQISVRGSLSAAATLDCFRCLRSFQLSVQTPLQVFAERSGTGNRHEEDELERDAYMTFHDGRRLDLRANAREALMLEMPMAPRCREDCRGLCPHCGADLNEGPCACR